jgi:hypothetical protein
VCQAKYGRRMLCPQLAGVKWGTGTGDEAERAPGGLITPEGRQSKEFAYRDPSSLTFLKKSDRKNLRILWVNIKPLIRHRELGVGIVDAIFGNLLRPGGFGWWPGFPISFDLEALDKPKAHLLEDLPYFAINFRLLSDTRYCGEPFHCQPAIH